MTNPLSRGLDHLVARTKRTDAMLVAEPRRYFWTLVAMELSWFVLVVLGWSFLPILHDPWRFAAAVAVGLQLGRASLVSLRRAGAYRAGWLQGRAQMVSAMGEAMRRGMTMTEWLSGELTRDYAVLGLDLDVVDLDTPDD